MTLTQIDGLTLVHTRSFADAALNLKDGRLTGRLVPYDSPTWVRDILPNGKPDIYREGFRRGAFDRLLRDPKGNAGRLEFKHRHDGGLGYLGAGVELEDGDDGFRATFRIVPGHRENVASLLEDGHRGLSIEFREVPETTVEEDDVRWRTDVILTGVALEWRGAYSEAEVLAYRSEIEADHSEQEAAEAAARERAEAEEAERLERERLEAEASEKARRQAEAKAWVEEQERLQAELVAKYKP